MPSPGGVDNAGRWGFLVISYLLAFSALAFLYALSTSQNQSALDNISTSMSRPLSPEQTFVNECHTKFNGVPLKYLDNGRFECLHPRFQK